ncbi:MAG: sulfatase-like hydrolase/transferase [Bacteroidaceae bacterium]|nr:sulfatase-like hydrolase/transferase [Bacteroidaceae bacterium]
MKSLGKYFGIILASFLLAKVAFMLYNCAEHPFGVGDVFLVMWHGLRLDLSTAGYLSIIPWAISMLALWVKGNWPDRAAKYYSWFTAIVLAVIFVTDTTLYKFWQFKLDSTIFNYLDDPKGVLANVSVWFSIIALIVIAALTYLLYRLLRKVWRCSSRTRYPHRKRESVILLVIAGLMFLMIRGGIGRSTMNIGYSYYSQDQFLNHSAVNPLFSLISSTIKEQDFNKLYHYYDDDECNRLFDSFDYNTRSTDVDKLLSTSRPNIVILIMEGCGSVFLEKTVTPNVNNLCNEGIYFSRCYANSFRTDRGLVSLLSGYPAFPDLSVMKHPDKSATLPSLARSLTDCGYTTSFLYGGDINFTNTKSYLLSTGYQQVRGYETFPASARHTHSWGVQDHIALDTLYNIINRQFSTPKLDSDLKPVRDRSMVNGQRSMLNAQCSMVTCLTLSSHEDWQVPYHRIEDDKVANAMGYLDHCIGQFVARLKSSPVWDNLLLIITSDHGISYPPGINEANPDRNRIPVVWVGGAVRQPRRIETLCNQSDIAATLLGQLGLQHSNFTFSRDVMSSSYTAPSAIHTFSGGITYIDTLGYVVEDLRAKKIISSSPQTPASFQETATRKCRSYLQKAMRDFADR